MNESFPFLLPPWRKTHADYSNRITIQDKATEKDKATSDHLHSISPLKTSMNHIIVYTDGSQKVISKRTHRTGAACKGTVRRLHQNVLKLIVRESS